MYTLPKSDGEASMYTQVLYTLRKPNEDVSEKHLRVYIYEKISTEVRQAQELVPKVIVGRDFNEPHDNKSMITEYMTLPNLTLATTPEEGTPTPPASIQGGNTIYHI